MQQQLDPNRSECSNRRTSRHRLAWHYTEEYQVQLYLKYLKHSQFIYVPKYIHFTNIIFFNAVNMLNELKVQLLS